LLDVEVAIRVEEKESKILLRRTSRTNTLVGRCRSRSEDGSSLGVRPELLNCARRGRFAEAERRTEAVGREPHLDVLDTVVSGCSSRRRRGTWTSHLRQDAEEFRETGERPSGGGAAAEPQV